VTPVSPAGERQIPVQRPQLPSSERLLPYLRAIDATRVYSNFGPLVTELERRLTQRLTLSPGALTTASCGTTALIGAIIAAAGRGKSPGARALVPAFTFVATATAAEQCGYEVFLADVDGDSWMLQPERLLAAPGLERVDVVVPVAPFGRPVPQAPWQAFHERTGIPVVIDGAAAFEGVVRAPSEFLGQVPVVISFHATKSFATGEGGCVACTDVELVRRASRALNFGFYGDRDSRSASTNGRMTEYHAAVGLAELDGWDDKQAAQSAVLEHCRRAMDRAGLLDRFLSAPEVSSCYALFVCVSSTESRHVQALLRERAIDYRLWYGTGLQDHSYFTNLPRERLDVTCKLAPRVLGIPMAIDLEDFSIARIVDALSTGITRAHSIRE
jgi:dTDP-4-amino-4,6-dideoxygalactose transaminase